MPDILELARIHPDPDNIRDAAHDDDIDSLAADIKSHGLLQPIVVYPAHDDDGMSEGQYLISAGHRRFFAVTSLGWTTVDVKIIDHPADDLARIDLMVSENLQRRQLDPIEEAKVYRRYTRTGLTQADVARRLNVPPSRVSDTLGLLTLSKDVQRRVQSGQIAFRLAREMVRRNRENAGTIRPDHGGKHRTGYKTPYFTTAHKLYNAAASRCAHLDHDPGLRIGAACGECWEHTIRLDAAKAPLLINETPPQQRRRPVERFSDPRDILRRIKCTRCGVGALERPNEQRCTAVRDGRRVLFDRHEFPMEVTPDDHPTRQAANA